MKIVQLFREQQVKVTRSPAKVAWHVSFNGQCIDVQPTKKKAEVSRQKLLAVMAG